MPEKDRETKPISGGTFCGFAGHKGDNQIAWTQKPKERLTD